MLNIPDQNPDIHERVMKSLRDMRDADASITRALRPKGKPAQFRADYEVWDSALGYWRKCNFFFFASDEIEARRQAVLLCRNQNGQPIDYNEMRVSKV